MADPTPWRVSETGREAHLVNRTGTTVCGATGTSWRIVAGAPRCQACLSEGAR